jgi:hypothetical protein
MRLLDVNWSPSARHLRQFGWCALAALPLFAWLRAGFAPPAAWDGGQWALFGWLLAGGAALAGLGLAWPRGLKPLFLAAMLVTLPIGIVLGEVLLASVYFLIFTPVALLFGLIGRDSLRRKLEPAAVSYWQPRTQPRDALQYYRQS